MIPVCVKDEFGPLQVAVVHDAANATDISMDDLRQLVPPDELRDHPETGPVTRARLIEQQAAFLRLLAFRGVTLHRPDPQPSAFCQVFTRDPCFAIGDRLFLGSFRDAYRHPEVGGLLHVGRQVPRVTCLWGGGATIEGGDVLVLGGRAVLVGTNRHTNEAGFENLARELGAEVVRVPHRGLHLDCCLAPLPDGEALYAPGLLPDETLALLGRHFTRLTPLDAEEAALHLAANLLWLDAQHVVSGQAARRTNALLRSRGHEVYELDFSQLVSLWGSFRCVTCPLVRG
jgi:N-dimethylarginine dimethylaminohydrolase